MAKASKAKKGEIIPMNENLPVTAGFDFGGKFKVTKQVTLPTFKITEGIPRAFTFNGEIYEAKPLKGKAGIDEETGKAKKAVLIAPVTDEETGEIGQIVVGAVLGENLMESYPDHGYVGKTFGILKMATKEGKRYKEYQVAEMVKA